MTDDETADRTHQTVKLSDGRTLGFAEYGDLNGKPVFELHGNPSSRLGAAFFDEAARKRGVRVIGVDRPGMGLSDFKPDRKLLGWPDDLLELANALNIDRFGVVGGSGGAPSVLACAYKIPERLTAVGILFAPSPFGAPGAARSLSAARRIQALLGRHGPLWIGVLALRGFVGDLQRNPDRAVSKLFRRLPQCDLNTLQRPKMKQLYVDAMLEAFRSGTRGVALDYALSVKPWGFRLADISTKVELWHGEDDTVVPPSMGQYIADAIPHCRVHFLLHEGHFSLLPNHVDEIVDALVM